MGHEERERAVCLTILCSSSTLRFVLVHIVVTLCHVYIHEGGQWKESGSRSTGEEV